MRTIYWQCPACSEKLETPRDFSVHVERNHNHIVDSDLLDDFAESCKHSELISFSCPVCEKGNDRTLDAIGEHIRAFFLLGLSWHVSDLLPDELEHSQRKEFPIPDTDPFAAEDELEVSDVDRHHDTDRFEGLETFANEPAEPVVLLHPKPDPEQDSGRLPHHQYLGSEQSNEPLMLAGENWDLHSVSHTAAVQMLAQALQSLSNITGDVVAPVYRRYETGYPLTTDPEMVRRFFVKAAPPFSITDYLLRIHKFAPHSSGVYLAATSYIYRLCVVTTVVPATPRTVHRLALAAIRIASKALEDNKWSQERIARLGGTSTKALLMLEIGICCLLDFDLFLRPKDLQRSMWLLQSTARQGLSVRQRISEGFKARLYSGLSPEAQAGG
jgi:hypothetical protein